MDDREASHAGGETAKRQRAKSSKDGRKPGGKVTRLQLHLPDQTVKRLGVHCTLKGVSWSEEAGTILLRYLAEKGRGRELFASDPTPIPSAE